jgi:glutamate dehydrogenase
MTAASGTTSGIAPASGNDLGRVPISDYQRLLEEKEDAVRAAAERAPNLGQPADGLPDYLQAFYRHASPLDVVAMDPLDIVGLALSLRQTASVRSPDVPRIRVFNPTLDEHGWSSGHTVVEVVTDDMPFLVDSLTGMASQAGRAIHFVVHPQMLVERDGQGHLLAVEENTAGGAADGRAAESWLHFGLDRDTDPQSLAQLRASVEHVLGDVRAAVQDWGPMRMAVADAAQELSRTTITGLPEADRSEAVEFLQWLADGHFTLLGYREYRLVGDPGHEALALVPDTGLGILREDPGTGATPTPLPEPARRLARDPHPLIITKANSRSTVHRAGYLDYIGVKVFDQRGEVIGERRMLGLFTASAYAQSVRRIPLLRRKAAEVLRRSGYSEDSHGGKDLLQFLETYPRDELFQVDPDELLEVSMSVLGMQERRQTRMFLRRDPYERFASVLVYLPRDRFNTGVRLRLEAILLQEFGAASVDVTTRMSESVLARLHCIARMPPGVPLPHLDEAALEQQLVAASRSWDDDFAAALAEQAGEEEAAELRSAYGPIIPTSFKEQYAARTAVADIRRLAALPPDGMALNLSRPYSADELSRRLKIYRRGGAVTLSQVLPMLQHLGVAVVDERPYTLPPTGPDEQPAHVYDFGLRLPGPPASSDDLKERFEDAFAAVFHGRAEADGFNALVITAGLTWREALVLRIACRYLRQIGLPFSQEYLESAINAHPVVSRLLVELFGARFDPGAQDAQREAELVAQIGAQLDAIASADHDRILRTIRSFITAAVRTNYYRRDADGGPRSTIAVKLHPDGVIGIPKPVPMVEIWVHSPRVEGVHLRFGPVARGGLRWSDRPEDFRTEVLGLVKAQAVKNAVIVPSGAKGGFVPRHLPSPAVDRAAWLAEGQGAYQRFIAALLDVTDNLVAGQVVPPADVVRHDDDDPYLVVAADKGTATFSDLANEISQSLGFWLGDAFASGGSEGYDHKAMGITARGAWESVKKHFRELGVDCQQQDFTAVGIGDMSGDVFGNGMLLSPHIRLVAAFDHRHIFLDPDPDPAASLAERRRLFELPRSSWADYDRALVSAGGGVHPRTAKQVPVSPQVRAVLGMPDGPDTVPPAELLRAILAAPVDLLWNGGIGTYVKSSQESHADVGDKANDAIRIDGAQVRARVVGEGGNLGLTQLGRIEAALHGVKLNTDAIDNSAGVDTSDHEVNIKILLDSVMAGGDITGKQRRQLLAAMTDDVARLVLQNNYDQNLSLATSRELTPGSVGVQLRLVRELERRGRLDRALEFLPADDVVAQRQAAGIGLTSPELSVLLAYAKMSLKADLAASPLPDDPYFAGVMHDYFPLQLQERFADRMESHPLRRDIVITCLVNDMVDHGGSTFAFRTGEDQGASPVEVVRSYAFTRDVFGLPELWRRIAALDTVVPDAAQMALYLEVRRLLDRGTRWLIQTKGIDMDLTREVAMYAEPVQRVRALVPDLLRGAERAEFERLVQGHLQGGVPAGLASDVAVLLYQFALLDVVSVAARVGQTPESVAALYFTVTERFAVDSLLTRISKLPRIGRWQTLARLAVRSDLYAAAAGLTGEIARETPADLDADERFARWAELRSTEVSRVRAVLSEIDALESHDLATLSVAMRSIRTLLSQTRAARQA